MEDSTLDQIIELRKQVSDLGNEKRELERKLERQETFNKALAKRYNAQLMSVYYMLEAVEKTGTHRQKETVIMFQKVVLQNLIQNGDPLPFHQDELPF